MTIERAREMGDQFAGMTDEQVLDFISNMGILADALLDTAIKDIREGKTIADVEKEWAKTNKT